MPSTASSEFKTSISGFDSILGGGLPRGRLYLVQGEPGTGKTPLAQQFLLEGIQAGEKCLYVTFSETKDELESVADAHGWDLSELAIFDLSTIEYQHQPESQNTVFHPAAVEMNETVRLIVEDIDRVKPNGVVFDSVTELRMLSDTSLRYRRQILALKALFRTEKYCDVFGRPEGCAPGLAGPKYLPRRR